MTSEELAPSVGAAIRELEEAFPDSRINWRADSQGGAFVTMEDVPLNPEIFVQGDTWVGFRIGFQYPAAEVYPHHIRSDLARRDGTAIAGKGFHPGKSFDGRQSLMLSRVSKRRDAREDTAVTKLRRVLAWLEQCP